METKSRTGEHAKRELAIMVKIADKDNRPVIEPFVDEIIALAEKFGNSGQSAGSAPYVASALGRAVHTLCLQQPVSPITGHVDEWNDVTEVMGTKKGKSYQNNRLGSIFMMDGMDLARAVFIDAIIWCSDAKDEQGNTGWDTFTGVVAGYGSSQYVKSFPFKPKSFYVDVVREVYDPKKHGKDEGYSSVEIEGKKVNVVHVIKNQKQIDEVFTYYNRADRQETEETEQSTKDTKPAKDQGDSQNVKG